MTSGPDLIVPDPPPPAVTGGDRVRIVLRGIGQTLITAGLVVLLFVVYEVWVTNIFAHHEQSQVRKQFEQALASGTDPLTRLALPDGKQATIPTGTGIANLYIPRLGKDYAFTIVEGTDQNDLEKGPGHYVGTALPGQVGNFAVAGHRVGKGEPFLNLDQLRVGDAIVIETEKAWFIYRVKGDPRTGDLSAEGADGVPGREIVDPSAGRVVLPVPNHPGSTPTEKFLTFTTCHPKYTANQRMVIHALMARQVARVGSALPRELSGGTL